ncbi:MAG TPA: hypothetical protein VK577_20865 [Bradyrhizobium sp.]|nr:hypothetical protein [Bradyrhizobium sp.]
MKVFVLMGNDFPDRVFANETEANEVCQTLMDARGNQGDHGFRRIYWRVYPFELQGALESHMEE